MIQKIIDGWIFLVTVMELLTRGVPFLFVKDLKKQSDMLRDFFSVLIPYWRIGVRVEGLEHIDHQKRYMIISNHQSLMDIPVMFHTVPLNFRIAAKIELFRIPVFGNFLRHGNFIPIYRDDSRAAIRALELTRRIIADGGSVYIYPEGTRSRTGELLPFKKGAFVLAVQHQIDILPVVLINTRNVVKKGSIHINWQEPITVKILPPISVQGKTYEDRDQLKELAETIMRDVLVKG